MFLTTRDFHTWFWRQVWTFPYSVNGQTQPASVGNSLTHFQIFSYLFLLQAPFWIVTVISKVTWLFFYSHLFFLSFWKEMTCCFSFFLSFFLVLFTFKFLKKLFFPQNKLGFFFFFFFSLSITVVFFLFFFLFFPVFWCYSSGNHP